MALTKVTGHVVKPDTNIQFHNTKSTGIVTFTHTSNATSSTTGALQITGGVGIVKDLHVGGNVTVGGTLTYDDVTNIDSLGIITARGGINVSGGNVTITNDLDVDGHTELDNLSVAGIATFRNELQITPSNSSAYTTHLNYNNIGTNYISHANGGATVFRNSTSGGTAMVIQGSNNAVDINSTLRHLDDTDTMLKFGTNTISLLTANVERTRTTEVGRVGIGTTNPVAHLEVASYQNIEVLRLRDRHFNKYLTIQGGGTPNRMVIDSYEGGGGGADIDLASNGDTKVRIGSDGKVGIGTDAVGSQLSIGRASGNGVLTLDAYGVNRSRLIFRNSVVRGTQTTIEAHNDDLRLVVNSGNRLNITSDGNVGVGVTNPDSLFSVTASENTAYDSSQASHQRDLGATLRVQNLSTTSNSFAQIILRNQASNVGGCRIVSINKGNNASDLAITAGDITEALRITSAAKVGIGEDTPLGKLHVKEGDSGVTSADTSQDTLFLENNGNAGLTIATPNANTGYLTFADPEDSNVGQIIYRHGGSNPNSMAFFVNTAEKLTIKSDGTVIVANKLTNSASYTSHNTNFYGGDVNTGGVRIEHAHSTTTVSGNTASGAFPHHLLLSNYSGSGSDDNRMASIGFDIPTSGAHANATIAYQATGAGAGDLQFWLESGNVSYERLRITSDGRIGIGGFADSSSRLGVNASSTVELSDSSGLYNQTNPAFLQIKNSTDGISDPECGIILQPRNSGNGAVALYAKRTGTYTSDLIYRTRTGANASAERLRIDSRGNVKSGTVTSALNFTDSNSGNTKFIEVGATGGGDALFVTHSSGYGVGYFGYEAAADRLVIACDNGGGNNKIDFITDAGTTTGGGTDNLNAKVPKMRIDANGNVMIGRTSASKKFSIEEQSGSSGVHYIAQIGGSNHVSGYAVGIAFDPEGYSARTKMALVAEGTSQGYSRGKFHFLLDAANDSGEATLSESRMTITDGGYVGISTSNPQSALHVRGAGGIRVDALGNTPQNQNSNVLTDGAGNAYISGSPWFSTNTYHYDASNNSPAMDFYWIKIVESFGYSTIAYVEYMCHSDSNYPRSVHGRIDFAKYGPHSLSISHQSITPQTGITPELVIDSNKRVWIRMNGAQWNSDFRFRLIYGESINLNTDFTVGTDNTSASTGKMLDQDATPLNASGIIESGANLRWDLNNANPPKYWSGTNTSTTQFTYGDSAQTYSSGQAKFFRIGTRGRVDIKADHQNHALNVQSNYLGVNNPQQPVTALFKSQKNTVAEFNRMYTQGILIQFRQNNDARGYIENSGTTTDIVTSGSDIRLKKNFEDWTEEILPHFKTLKPKKFHFNEESDDDKKTKGYIAQDNLDKFPEAYPENPNDDRYWFKPGAMVPYLMKALQEEIIKREEIEAKYNALEARISALESDK